MISFAIKNNQFIYGDTTHKKVLLDCENYLYNKSRIPLHDDEGMTNILELLLGLFEEGGGTHPGAKEQEMRVYYTMVDAIVTAEHIKTAEPKKVLELGCGRGILSYHLATIIGKLHPESLLYGINNTIGNESGNLWLDYIVQVEELPRIAFAAVDYEDTQLGKEQFDITILNECEQMEETKKIVEEAIRVTKPGGKIICLANHQPLLEAMFKLLLPEHEVYFPEEEIKILVAERRE